LRVTFLPEGRTWAERVPTLVSEAAALCDILIDHACGTRGRCTRCRVRFLEGATPPTDADRARLSYAMLADGWRLSCQAMVTLEAVVEVPPTSRTPPAKSFGPETLPGGSDGADGLGLAVDLGSTTVAAALVDLTSTRVLAQASELNDHVRYGADVVSRIRFAMDHADGAARLTATLRTCVDRLAADVCARGGVDPASIREVVACGNGAMSHAFAGGDVVSLGLAPYHGTFTAARELRGEDIGGALPSATPVLLLPQIASHVGGDTVAAILATGLERVRGPRLLVDLGTNTEVVLATPEGLEVASAAAGPAFEGAEIAHGMRAEAGAIDRVSWGSDGHLAVRVVGGGRAEGLCGTGLVDAVAALLEMGIVEPGGRMKAPAEIAGPAASTVGARLVHGVRGHHAFRLSDPDAEGVVALHARDVRQLQLVKGSIGAAVALLLERRGLTAYDLEDVQVAGAFGTHLRKWTALRIGLVPAIDPERIRIVGDAAAVGARMALCRRADRERAQAISERAAHVELATDPRYADAFAAAIPFPAAFPVP